jgi:hypothetical protein
VDLDMEAKVLNVSSNGIDGMFESSSDTRICQISVPDIAGNEAQILFIDRNWTKIGNDRKGAHHSQKEVKATIIKHEYDDINKRKIQSRFRIEGRGKLIDWNDISIRLQCFYDEDIHSRILYEVFNREGYIPNWVRIQKSRYGSVIVRRNETLNG